MTLEQFAKAIVEKKPLQVLCGDGVLRDTVPTDTMMIQTQYWQLKPDPPKEKTLGQIAYEAHKRSLENRGGYNIAWDRLRPEQQGDWELGAEAVANKLGVTILHGDKSSFTIKRAVDGLYRDEGKMP